MQTHCNFSFCVSLPCLLTVFLVSTFSTPFNPSSIQFPSLCTFRSFPFSFPPLLFLNSFIYLLSLTLTAFSHFSTSISFILCPFHLCHSLHFPVIHSRYSFHSLPSNVLISLTSEGQPFTRQLRPDKRFIVVFYRRETCVKADWRGGGGGGGGGKVGKGRGTGRGGCGAKGSV